MKNKTLIITFLLFCNLVFCQETEVDTKYKAETKSLINFILKVFLSTPYLNIERTATRVKIENCKEKYESPIFNKSELYYIKQNINNPKIIYWTNEYFPTLNIIEDKKNEKNSKNEIELKSEDKYQHKGTVADFSSPIFLRNYGIAIIRFSEYSGELSGVGYEGIFIKKGDDWEIDVCSWDN